MGIGRGDLELLLRLKREGYLPGTGKVIEIGAQQLNHTVLESPEFVGDLGRAFGAAGQFGLPSVPNPALRNGEYQQDPNAPMARSLWNWLGFGYDAVDIDNSDDSIPLDLNFDDVPREKREQYDLVTNYGTTEHVANQLNAFKIIHDLAKPGSIMVHNLPCQGYMTHGLVNYPPKFFWNLARSNGYQWIYFDYHAAREGYKVPDDLVDAVAVFSPSVRERLAAMEMYNSSLVVVLKKRAGPYVPPIDVPDSVRTNNATLLARYPGVFTTSPGRALARRLPRSTKQLIKRVVFRWAGI